MNPNFKFQSGFTLIEIILYIAIVTVMLSALIPFAWNIIGGSVKSATQQEVYAVARHVSERIKYEIRNASGINNVSTSSISLSNSVPSLNPTVISLSSGNVTIQQGGGAIINLNSADTQASSLMFTDYTSTDNKTKHIGFTMDVATVYSGPRQEFKETVSLRSSAELRSN